MACMTTEKSSLGQKRCSLPGPGGGSGAPLNLYAGHQQRRLSERGLMIYKPNKPDIDLIRDFTNANNQRKHSTPNFTLYPGGAPSCSSTAGGGLRYAHGTFGSLSQLNRNFHGLSSTTHASSVSAGPSPSSYRRNSSLAYFSSYAAQASSTPEGNNTNINGSSSSSAAASSGAAGSSARKVRIKIHKNPGATTEKYVELHSVGGNASFSVDEDDEGDGCLEGDDMTENERSLFLRGPHFDSRRFSDTAALCRGPTAPAITFSLTPAESGGLLEEDCNTKGMVRRASDTPGIVLSTGDLETLKCLTSSAQEISSASCGESSGSGEGAPDQSERAVSPTNFGNRSKSFDATLSASKRGLGSSWFARRHLPMSYKMPNPSSPSSAGNQPLSQQLRTPILTITNENACQSELIEIPSPPTVTPVSSGGSPNEVASTVPWDKNGYILDAALLGSAIENHLKEGNRKRRATFSTLYQAPPSSVESKVTTRARSASACVIPINPKELVHGSSGGGSTNRRESIGTDRVIPNFPLSAEKNRRSSLKSMVRFPWESAKDSQQSPETKALLWESPIEYTNTGSFIRTTVTDFGAECIDEEEEERPETTSGSGSASGTTITTTTFGHKNGKAFVANVEVTHATSSGKESSSAPNTGNAKKGVRMFELPSSASAPKSKSLDKGESHSHSAPASPKPTKRNSENNMSICSAIRDFIIHSIRS